MRIDGTLSEWNDERGFGFIEPATGGPKVFVHVSAFPKDGLRPQIGERLNFEIETDSNGKKQAKRLVCQDRSIPRQASTTSRSPRSQPGNRSRPGFIGRILPALALAALAYYGYGHYAPPATFQPIDTPEPVAAAKIPTAPAAPAFKCDGRTHCSQMTSCAEATFFLRNCPDVKMDGNNDGVPCEKQWCTNPFARW